MLISQKWIFIRRLLKFIGGRLHCLNAIFAIYVNCTQMGIMIWMFKIWFHYCIFLNFISHLEWLLSVYQNYMDVFEISFDMNISWCTVSQYVYNSRFRNKEASLSLSVRLWCQGKMTLFLMTYVFYITRNEISAWSDKRQIFSP